jgi:hypothetical protein
MILVEKKEEDAFIVRTCENTVVLDMIEYLTYLRDVNARQTIYLIPCNENRNLLLKKPKSWEEIKDGKFLKIIG